jgi:hypothetical protein
LLTRHYDTGHDMLDQIRQTRHHAKGSREVFGHVDNISASFGGSCNLTDNCPGQNDLPGTCLHILWRSNLVHCLKTS